MEKNIEEDLSRLELEHRALVELCLRKKLFTRAEFKAMKDEIDAVDGDMDRKVPKIPRGKE